MAITSVARYNHDRLFPQLRSTLAVSDPELIEVFDNFAFDEVLSHDDLDERLRLMTQLATLIAVPSLHEYGIMLNAALDAGVTPVEVKEIVYQAVPYCGMARVFDFLHATNDVLTARGVVLPLPSQRTTDHDDRHEIGFTLRDRIVGGGATRKAYDDAPADELHIQRYLSANCFGDYISRNGLDIQTRELLTFSMLATLGGCDPQLKGHVAANVNVGNDRTRLINVLTQLLPFIGYPRMLNALRAIDEVTLT